jgi:uncharacterized protein (DUF779 family)
MAVSRVSFTPIAADLINRLRAVHGDLLFHQSGGCHLIIDAVPGRGAGFSLEAPEGMRFLTRSRVFTDAEFEELERTGPPPCGPEAMDALRSSAGQC